MRMRAVVALVTALAFSIGLSAQAKPDFSGEWTMVPDKSNFGPMPAPATMTRTITHKDPIFKVVTVTTGGPNGDTTVQTTLSTDGKPQQNTVNGAPMTTVGKWEGTTLVFNSTLASQGTNVSIEDRYTLADAGKTLTVARTLTTPDGSALVKIVLTKK